MSDESLDNIFKKGLSGRNVSFNMESWRRMEEMLPPEPKAPKFKFGYAAALVGLLLVTSVSVLFWDTNSNTELAMNNPQGNTNPVYEERVGSTSIIDVESDYDENKDLTTLNSSIENVTSKLTTEGSNDDISSQENENSHFTTKKQASSGKGKRATSKTNNALFASENGSNSGFFANKKLGKNRSTDKHINPVEEKVSFASNSFTKIHGVEELLALSGADEETNVVIANVSNAGLPKVSKNVFGFIGGINFNQSLVESPNNGVYVSELLGVEYQRYLNGGLSLKANLLYSARSGVNTSKTYDKKEYDFGSRTEQSTVECQRIIYMELPVLLNYGVANHNFMVGPSFSYFVNSLNKVTTKYETFTTSNTEENMVWGKTDGFKPYDFAIVAGYEYSLKSRLNLGVRLNYGLIDVTENSYFKNQSFDNNVQLRVYLTFSPFQF